VSEKIILQYVGFQVKASGREYTFNAREVSSEPRAYTVSIENEAFASRRARYQDAPDICSIKLKREFATYANHPPKTHYKISHVELDEYRETRKQRHARL
jgi:hypothetical protein